jgi:hypothetical protein
MGVKLCYIKGRTQIEAVTERDAEDNIKTDEILGSWRKLYIEGQYSLYSL